MSKKLHSKLLSVILIIAICCATLCGSLIAAHAAADDYTGTYSFEGGIAPYGAKQASVNVTFASESGFVNGEFAVMNPTKSDESAFETTDVSAKVVSGTKLDGTTFNADEVVVNFNEAEDLPDGVLDYVSFWDKNNNNTSYTSLTFELTYTFASPFLKTEVLTTDVAEVLLSSVATDSYIDVSGTTGIIHSHYAWVSNTTGTSVPESDRESGKVYYSVNNSATCTNVKDSHTFIQMFPDMSASSTATSLKQYPDGNVGVSGVSVNYNNDGTLNVDIHGYSQPFAGNNFIVITDPTGKVLEVLENSESKKSSYAGSLLADSAQMWTYSGMSARDIDTDLVITMLALYGEQLIYSTSLNFSLADYCEKVVNDEAVWPDYATEQDIINDKDVAAALYYYGAAINDSVFDKNTGTSTTINYEEKDVVVWDGKTKTALTDADKDENGTYIITTAEQLAWLALGSGTSTAGNEYKIADNIGAIYINDGTRDLTLSQVENNLNGNNTNVWSCWAAHAKFQGTFDGNGVTIYGLYATGINNGSAHQGGLFPYATDGATIKNVKITNSYIAGVNITGAVVGYWDTDGGSLIIENCIVNNCYITTTTTNQGWVNSATGLFGGGQTPDSISISDCAVYGNKHYSASNETCAAFVGQYTNRLISEGVYATVSIKNSIAIGAVPWCANESYWGTVGSVFENVYTDCDISTSGQSYTNAQLQQITDLSTIKGVGAVATMNLGSAWFDTASYPELSVFHKLTKVYIDETSHKTVCVHQFVNGDVKTPCDLAGITEEHVFDIDEVDYIKECECGYTVDILGNYAVPQEASSSVWGGTSDIDTKWDTDGNGNYLITSAAELYGMVTSNGLVNDTPASFKVADGIKAFYLNDIKSLIDKGADTETIYTELASGNNWNSGSLNGSWSVTAGFQGSFDGNGATIYGLYANNTYNAGFIPIVLNNAQTTTIKNISFKYSYIQNTSNNNIRAGVVVGATGVNEGYKDGNSTTLNFENVRVENAKFVTAIAKEYAGWRGGICGESQSSKTNITSCFVSDITELDTAETKTATQNSYYACGLIHNVASNALTVTDSVEINVSEQSVTYLCNISNSYSTMGTGTYIKLASAEAAKGTAAKDNMPLLDWEKTWFTTTDGYPELHVFHDMITECIDENTHQYVCQLYIDGVQCPVNHAIANHTLEKNDETNSMVCTCGYSEEINGTLIDPQEAYSSVWGGTSDIDTKWDTDGNGNYLITSAAELYGMVTSNGLVNDTPASFKVADGIKAFYLNDIKSLIDSGADAETIYDAFASGNNWNSGDLNGSYKVTEGFQGSFDGNGATIYGLYAYNTYNAGFIPTVLNNGQITTIKNISFKYSYIQNTSNNNIRAGVVVGATGVNEGYKDGNSTTLNFENVRVENAKFVTAINNTYAGWRGGICGESQSSKTNITSCFVSDITELDTNETRTATKNSYYACGLIHNVASNALTVTDSVEINVSDESVTNNCTISNSYSTKGTGTYINLASADLAKGAAAKDNMPLLDWADTWFTTTDGYPELHAFHDMKTVTLDNGYHQYMCQHYFVDDGAYCDVCQAAEAHTFTETKVDGVTVASCEDCNYSYKVEGIYQILENSTVILNWMMRSENEIFKDFVSNSAFKAAYAADSQTIQSAANNLDIYATSLNLKVNPYIAFTFAFNSPYLQDRQNITINFTVGNDVYTTNPPEYVQGEHFSKTADSQLNGNWTNNKGAGRYHLYRFTALPVSKLCEPIKVSVVYEDKTYAEGTYSVAGYAIEAINAGEDYVYHANASMALVYYSEMLAKYLAN